MYRFKTEKEFEDEFGYWWKELIIHGWDLRMNYLFGKKITKEQYHSHQWPLKIDGWAISKQMVKEDHLFPVFQRLKEVFL
jgi:hypothetical protein